MSTPDEGAGSGSSQTEAPWYDGVVGWLPLSRTFIDRELVKPEPDYRSLDDRLAPYSPAERHAGWIGIAQSAPSRMARTRAYVEALHNDPDPTSVAWSWLDGDFDLMERVEHILSPDDEHTPATVDALRNRVGSILEVGGADMEVPAAQAVTGAEAETEAGPAGGHDAAALAAAETAAQSEADGAGEASSGVEADEPVGATTPDADGATAANDAWAGLTEDPEFAAAVAAAQPAAGEPAAAPQTTQPVAAAAQAVQPGATAPWVPTHFVPAGGMSAWDYPDPSRPPRAVLNAGLGLVIEGIAGDWALVRAVNGWRGWVDGRRLTTPP